MQIHFTKRAAAITILTAVFFSIAGTVVYAYVAPTSSFSLSPTNIVLGQNITLSFSSTNGSQAISSASIDNNVGNMSYPGSGTRVVSPTGNTTFTFTAADGRTTLTKTASVTMSTCSMSITPTTVSSSGAAATLSWTSSNVSSVTFDNGIGTVALTTGSMTLHPTVSTTYKGTFVGTGGAICYAMATVTVGATQTTTYNSAGTYQYTVPAYSSMTVLLKGGGQGGQGGSGNGSHTVGATGSPGGNSSFVSSIPVIAAGGANSGTANYGTKFDGGAFNGGSPGLNYGQNTRGAAGDYVAKTWLSTDTGAPEIGSSIGVVVGAGGAGGAGGSGTNTGDSGSIGGSGSVIIMTTSDATGPTVTLTNPSNNSTVSGTNVTLAASASDSSGISFVRFKVDGVLVGQVAAAPYTMTWDSTSVANGSHTIAAVGRDTSGNYSTSSATVNVQSGATWVQPVHAQGAATNEVFVLPIWSGASSDQTKSGGLSVNALAVFGSVSVASKLGIGIASPVATLDIHGTLRLGSSSDTCFGLTEGAMRYNSSLKKVQFCNGTSWNSL